MIQIAKAARRTNKTVRPPVTSPALRLAIAFGSFFAKSFRPSSWECAWSDTLPSYKQESECREILPHP